MGRGQFTILRELNNVFSRERLKIFTFCIVLIDENTRMYVINLEFSIYTHKFKWLLGTEINAGFKIQQ